jgi:hypothetical protein
LDPLIKSHVFYSQYQWFDLKPSMIPPIIGQWVIGGFQTEAYVTNPAVRDLSFIHRDVSHAGGFVLTRQEAAGKWGKATYSLARV